MVGFSVAVFLCALIAIAAIALTVLLGVWVYRDAQNKGMNGILWTAVVILVPSYIGLIIYLIIRTDNKKVTCSNCATSVNGKNRFCSNCGVELVPAVEMLEDETFKKSQKKVLIGFFSTLGAIVVMTIFVIVAMIMGTVGLVEDAVEWVSKIDTAQWVETMEDTLENTLGDIDVLFNEDELHISVDGEQVEVSDKDGNELIKIDGANETVDVNLKDIRALLDENNVTYDENLSEKELEELITKEIEKAIEDAIEESFDETTQE